MIAPQQGAADGVHFRYGFAAGWVSACGAIFLLSIVFARYL